MILQNNGGLFISFSLFVIYLILKLITCIPVPAWRDQSAHCHQCPVVPTPRPPAVASQITGLKINFHLSLCQPQYNKTIFMKRSVLIWPSHLSLKLAFADFRTFLANIEYNFNFLNSTATQFELIKRRSVVVWFFHGFTPVSFTMPDFMLRSADGVQQRCSVFRLHTKL